MKAKVNDVWKVVKKYKYKTDNNEWVEVPTIKANFGQDGWHEVVPPNAIILYDLPKNELPNTALLCNGNDGEVNTTPNLIGHYVMMTTNLAKILEKGGSESHTGANHGTASGNVGYTNYTQPSYQYVYPYNQGTNIYNKTSETKPSTNHRHSGVAYHTHPNVASNHRKRKRLQPTMYDDVIRTNAIFLHTNGAFDGIFELIVYSGFIELADNNTAFLTESDNEIYNHNHGTYAGNTNYFQFSDDGIFGSNNQSVTRYNPYHRHSYNHTAASSGILTFPNQNFYTGKTTRKTYWDELPYGTVCLFTNDFLPNGWEKLSSVKKYSNGVVVEEVSTEGMMIYMDRGVASNENANYQHNHVTTITTSTTSNTFVGPVNSTNTDEAVVNGHTHTFPDNHSTMVSHRPPYIQLYVGYKVPPTYTVSFNANGGSGSQSSIVKTYHIALTMPTCSFVKSGYKLKNWNTSPDGNGNAYTEGSSSFNLNEDTTLYAIWEVDVYISAGTYTPSSFKSLIAQYVSLNGRRTVINSFTATVNGQTITVSAGASIYYRTTYSGRIYIVGFGTYTDNTSAGGAPTQGDGFTNYKTYIVDVTSGHDAVSSYTSYSITIGGNGITFN